MNRPRKYSSEYLAEQAIISEIWVMDILSLTRLLYDLQITTLYHQTAIEKLHEVMRSTNSQVDKKRAERLVIEHRGHLVRLEDSFITQTARDRYEKILKLGHSIDTWLYN